MSLEEQARLRLLWPQRGSITLGLPGDGEPPTVPKASKPFRGPTGVFSWDSNALVAPQVNKATKPYVLDAQNRPVFQKDRRVSVKMDSRPTLANPYMASTTSAKHNTLSSPLILPMKLEFAPAPTPRRVPSLRRIKGSIKGVSLK